MANESTSADGHGQRIDIDNPQDLRQWARTLDASEDQIREADQAVGARASDVEEHLKGSRANTNSERTHHALKGANPRT